MGGGGCVCACVGGVGGGGLEGVGGGEAWWCRESKYLARPGKGNFSSPLHEGNSLKDELLSPGGGGEERAAGRPFPCRGPHDATVASGPAVIPFLCQLRSGTASTVSTVPLTLLGFSPSPSRLLFALLTISSPDRLPFPRRHVLSSSPPFFPPPPPPRSVCLSLSLPHVWVWKTYALFEIYIV